MSGFPRDKFRNLLALIFVLIIMGGLLFVLAQKKKVLISNPENTTVKMSAPSEISKAGESIGAGVPDDDSESQDENDDAEEDFAGVEKGKPIGLSICDPKDSNSSIGVTHQRFLSLLREGQSWVPAVGSQACYQVGKSITLVERLIENGEVYAVMPRAEVEVVAVEEVPFQGISENKKFLLTKDEINHIRRALRRRLIQTGEKWKSVRIKFLHLKKKAWLEERLNYGAPMIHPRASTISLAELKTALQKGEIPYDVRSEFAFAAKTITGAANMPVSSSNLKQSRVLSPSELKNDNFNMPLGMFVGNRKKKSIIVFSWCEADFLSYNAITFLRQKGFRKIRWFRGGVEGWARNGETCATPSSVPDLPVVGAKEVRTGLRDGTVLIYVSESFGSAEYQIKDSVRLVYEQKFLDSLVPSYRPLKWSEDEFKASGDHVDAEDLHLSREKRIIVYGRNEFDWGAVKGALWLKYKGYSSVSWYRFGVADWLNHALYEPQNYPTAPPFIRK